VPCSPRLMFLTRAAKITSFLSPDGDDYDFGCGPIPSLSFEK
jgi:hypothetical protein